MCVLGFSVHCWCLNCPLLALPLPPHSIHPIHFNPLLTFLHPPEVACLKSTDLQLASSVQEAAPSSPLAGLQCVLADTGSTMIVVSETIGNRTGSLRPEILETFLLKSCTEEGNFGSFYKNEILALALKCNENPPYYTIIKMKVWLCPTWGKNALFAAL